MIADDTLIPPTFLVPTRLGPARMSASPSVFELGGQLFIKFQDVEAARKAHLGPLLNEHSGKFNQPLFGVSPEGAAEFTRCLLTSLAPTEPVCQYAFFPTATSEPLWGWGESSLPCLVPAPSPEIAAMHFVGDALRGAELARRSGRGSGWRVEPDGAIRAERFAGPETLGYVLPWYGQAIVFE